MGSGHTRLKQVCMLLRERHPDNQINRSDIDKAIREIVGVSPITIRDNFEALKKLGYIRGRLYKHNYYVTETI